jgi:hypothetical protein
VRQDCDTKPEIEAWREVLLDIIEAGKPMTVRDVFYYWSIRREGRKRLRQARARTNCAPGNATQPDICGILATSRRRNPGWPNGDGPSTARADR